VGDNSNDSSAAGEGDHISDDVEIAKGGDGADYIVDSAESTVANQFWGGPGADSLVGNGGADSLYGGTGQDTLQGGDGNDVLAGNDGSSDDGVSDLLDGGSGTD